MPTVPVPRITYESVVAYPDFSKIYTVAVEKTDMWGRLDLREKQGTLNGPMRALDIGGGTGTLGTLLNAEFGSLVDYANIDANNDLLAKSPGRTIHGNYENLSEFLGDSKFDYVFCLNFENRSKLHQRTINAMKRDGQGEGFFGNMVSDTQHYNHQMRQLRQQIVFMNVALVLEQGGNFIFGGVISKDALKAWGAYLSKLGFEQTGETKLPLGMEVSRLWARYDLQFSGFDLPPNQLERAAQSYAQNFKVVTFDKTKEPNRKWLQTGLANGLSDLSELENILITQERFWA